MSALFGWCMDGHHKACRVTVFDHRAGLTCGCRCHTESSTTEGESGVESDSDLTPGRETMVGQVKTARPGVCTSDRAYDHHTAKDQ